ncbi:DUF6471 domain-containing protein [Paraglaciecola aquimarina]|uniref:DUF6471 domain-containing protein n=1 Tax=Paraglaciecola aquimarina TaxID=1235557 RepID=A0ABU3T128_9ALTE|nr:DUF6471 domain-containing protein [Paraglaciecola aquimarina]MDU0355940.1 DUF6471 domain-containing protein [Paraglaciecola aquimarina]
MSTTDNKSVNQVNPNVSADWRQLVQRILKAEMSKRGTKYQDLSDRLAQIGIYQSADNLRNKVNKGIMGADLLLQIMYVLNMRRIERDDIVDIFADLGSPLE